MFCDHVYRERSPNSNTGTLYLPWTAPSRVKEELRTFAACIGVLVFLTVEQSPTNFCALKRTTTFYDWTKIVLPLLADHIHRCCKLFFNFNFGVYEIIIIGITVLWPLCTNIYQTNTWGGYAFHKNHHRQQEAIKYHTLAATHHQNAGITKTIRETDVYTEDIFSKLQQINKYRRHQTL